MIDERNGQQLKVTKYGPSWPYLMVQVSQLPEVRRLLDKAGIRYWVDEVQISLNGKPAMTTVNFGKTMDAGEIQSALDNGA